MRTRDATRSNDAARFVSLWSEDLRVPPLCGGGHHPHDVAPGWIKAKDRFGSVFEAVQQDTDCLLISGELIVGRVLRDHSGPQAGRYSWSLTGGPGASINNHHGIADTIEEAQAELMAAWAMAGVGRDAGCRFIPVSRGRAGGRGALTGSSRLGHRPKRAFCLLIAVGA